MKLNTYFVTDVDLYEHNPITKEIEASSPSEALYKFGGEHAAIMFGDIEDEDLLQRNEFTWVYDVEDQMFIIHKLIKH